MVPQLRDAEKTVPAETETDDASARRGRRAIGTSIMSRELG